MTSRSCHHHLAGQRGLLRDLPEELLHEILGYLLHRSIQEFFSENRAEAVSTSLSDLPRSHVLLVCKQWYRVGTPALFACLRLGCTTHTATVAKILQRNPRLGRFITYLRLDGGFDKDLYTIARLASNLEGLFINTDVPENESLLGLRLALPILRPSILYVRSLHVSRRPRNIKQTQMDALVETMVKESLSLVRGVTIFLKLVFELILPSLSRSRYLFHHPNASTSLGPCDKLWPLLPLCRKYPSMPALSTRIPVHPHL